MVQLVYCFLDHVIAHTSFPRTEPERECTKHTSYHILLLLLTEKVVLQLTLLKDTEAVGVNESTQISKCELIVSNTSCTMNNTLLNI